VVYHSGIFKISSPADFMQVFTRHCLKEVQVKSGNVPRLRGSSPSMLFYNTMRTHYAHASSHSTWTSQYSPLSSHDSDWKELRDCTSDRLSRALYGWEGFSSSGFLERQGSRSTTLAKRKRQQTTSKSHVGQDSISLVAVLYQRLLETHVTNEQLKEKKVKHLKYKTT
jgi:hypothetical protein